MNSTPFTPFKVGSLEVSVCIFRRAEFRLDDSMIARASLNFENETELLKWAETAGVEFK